ncbi:unnamed protein product [Acanthoscelides obtectus]|uniref:DUF4817 domain-containing protein n=1 Tax=Acanthoscelides obtectus TaxID=200917 RepID=A0A9P0LPW2_ACAOB|nr:unnamed protein product [Acanthoscelides obtectus]CAK1660630.1 hypothetical protein AOBTE_LOCUS22194 [Acanthoscelides obtectus]
MTDMHFVYGMALGKARRARRLYGQQFPQRPTPNVHTFINIHAQLCETGSFKRSTGVPGRPVTATTIQIEEV